jgi:hypothetical protein
MEPDAFDKLKNKVKEPGIFKPLFAVNSPNNGISNYQL